MRFFLATLVILSHALPIGGFPNYDPFIMLSHHATTLGTVAVAGFFALSGFLITRSYYTTQNIQQFLWHRFLRIFPGFWVCLIISAFVFAPLMQWLEKGSMYGLFESEESPLRYIYSNLFLFIHQWTIAGLPTTTPYHGINGSLWTLIHEFICYLGVGVFGVLSILQKRWTVVMLLILLWTLQLLRIHTPTAVPFVVGHPFIEEFIRLSITFFCGAVFFLFKDKVPFSGMMAIVAVLIYLGGAALGFTLEVESMTISYCMFWLTFKLPFQAFDKRGDFSYGLYIYAFPTQQMLAILGAHQLGYIPFVILGIIGTLIFAIPSYKFIEKPMLELKKIVQKKS
ncbi:MAG: acyltransferase [Ignavibacteria bacterium]|nr:acyltransferase [Ignavibacteria bacterium]